MILTCQTHRSAFELANMLIPQACWTAGHGDFGQIDEDDVALEDKTSEATLVLHVDGTATFSHWRLVSVTPHLRGQVG